MYPALNNFKFSNKSYIRMLLFLTSDHDHEVTGMLYFDLILQGKVE